MSKNLPVKDSSSGQQADKTRSGDVSEDEADLDWPVWAGVVPYNQQLAEPVRATGVDDQFDAPILVRPV